MTKLPVESWNIIPLEGPEYPDYKVASTCCVPFCTSFSDHAHHIVRRSFLGGDYAWVKYDDGRIFANKTGMCYTHHKSVTENRCQIDYEDGIFYWNTYVGDPAPLQIQPFVLDNVPSGEEPESEGHHDHTHDHHGPERKVCESCGRPLPKPKIEAPDEEKKPRRTWAISVPNDALEDGANVLDTLLEAARDELDRVGISYGNGSKVKYYPLTTSLALFVQNAEKILSDE